LSRSLAAPHSLPTRRSSDLDCADPVQTTELVDLPKIAPMPPVQTMMASAGNARTSMDLRSMAQIPRQTRPESSTAERNSQPSYLDRKSTRPNSSHVAISYAV